eukprot:g13247.t1
MSQENVVLWRIFQKLQALPPEFTALSFDLWHKPTRETVFIQKAKACESLSLSRVEPAEIDVLLKALPVYEKLRMLEIKQSPRVVERFEAIFQVLSDMQTVTRLSFPGNNLDDAAALTLFTLLQAQKVIAEISLRENNMCLQQGAMALSKVLHASEQAMQIDLEDNDLCAAAAWRLANATMLAKEGTVVKHPTISFFMQGLKADAMRTVPGEVIGQSLEEKLTSAAGLAVDLIETRPPELPEHQKVRGNLQTELTCISAALQSSSSSLPRSLVAVGTSDGFVKLLDGVTGRLAVQVSVARQLPKVIDLHLAEGTGVLLAASSDQAVRVLDLQRQRLLFTLCGHRGLVSACGWLQASRAFTAGADRTKTTCAWGMGIEEFVFGSESACHVASDIFRDLLNSATRTVKLWDVQTGQMVRSMPCPAPVTTARAHRSSGVVVAGYADGRLSVLDQRVPGPPADAVRLHQSAQAVVGVQLSQDGNWVLSQAQDGSLCCTALGCPEPTLRLQASGALDSGPSPPAFSPDGSHILARGAACVHCWTRDGQLVYNHDLQPTLLCSMGRAFRTFTKPSPSIATVISTFGERETRPRAPHRPAETARGARREESETRTAVFGGLRCIPGGEKCERTG